MIDMRAIALPFSQELCWYTYHNSEWFNILCNYCSCTNNSTFAYCNSGQNDRICPDVTVQTDFYRFNHKVCLNYRKVFRITCVLRTENPYAWANPNIVFDQ